MSAPNYIERARALVPRLAEASGATEAARRVDAGVLDALHAAGFFRMLTPARLGGGEASPSVFAETIWTLAQGDASPAWCLCQMAVCAIAAAYLEPSVAEEIFGPPDAALAWGSTRDAKAVAVEGGYLVSGTWEFGSGCHHASWLGGHCPVVGADGAPLPADSGRPSDRTVLFPRRAAEIVDTWRVLGLRGTGSDVYRLDGLFVPEAHAVVSISRWPDEARSRLALPFRFSVSALYASGFGALALGNARGMLDGFLALAQRKTPLWQRNPLSQNPLIQVAVAEADARLDAAWALIRQSLGDAEAMAMRDGAPDAERRLKIRAATTYAIKVATSVAQSVFEMAGTTAIFDGELLERRFRDAHTISQHLQGRTMHLEAVGKHLMGAGADLRFA